MSRRCWWVNGGTCPLLIVVDILCCPWLPCMPCFILLDTGPCGLASQCWTEPQAAPCLAAFPHRCVLWISFSPYLNLTVLQPLGILQHSWHPLCVCVRVRVCACVHFLCFPSSLLWMAACTVLEGCPAKVWLCRKRAVPTVAPLSLGQFSFEEICHPLGNYHAKVTDWKTWCFSIKLTCQTSFFVSLICFSSHKYTVWEWLVILKVSVCNCLWVFSGT